MSVYQRMTMVHAARFEEYLYREDPLKYPYIFDRAMFSELWFNKTAEEGRYYITKQAVATNDFETVYDGDYIVQESDKWFYVVPKETFEKNYEKLS